MGNNHDKALQYIRKDGTMMRHDGCLQHSAMPNRNGSYEDRAMAHKPLPTPEVIRQLFCYDADGGRLLWKDGKEAGTTGKLGYRQIRLQGKTMLVHRLIWAMETGMWPEGDIDHINGVSSDNRMENLRDVPHHVNMRNIRRASNSTTGVQGVYVHTQTGSYVARIKVNGKTITIGSFGNLQDAAQARAHAARDHGFHENHGGVR